MRYLLIIILAFFLSSCCGAKKAIGNTSKPEQKEIVKVIVREELKPILPENELPNKELEKPVIEDSVEVETINKGNKVLVKKDSIINNNNSHQELTKRTYSNVHHFWEELLQKHVSNEGNVNYKSFKTDHKRLLDYISVLSMFKSDNLVKTFSKEEKLAYWINAYNAMTIDLIVRNYPLKSIKDIKDPWEQRLWQFGDKWYNLNQIEHQILRKMDEPRIHFAIVCASYSCPKLQNEAFTASNLEKQLTNATKDFLRDTKRNNITPNKLEVSKIFKWFSKDFKAEGGVIEFIKKYSAVNISNSARISYKDYNWDLND